MVGCYCPLQMTVMSPGMASVIALAEMEKSVYRVADYPSSYLPIPRSTKCIEHSAKPSSPPPFHNQLCTSSIAIKANVSIICLLARVSRRDLAVFLMFVSLL